MFKLRRVSLVILALAVVLAGCAGSPTRKTFTYMVGDKASVERLTFSVVNNQVFTRLAIPALTLVDDSGKTYEELTDGSGVARWLGVVRHVAANQTETGAVVFDAPASHYKLKLTDDTDPQDVFIDLPLSFVNEQMKKQLTEGSPDGQLAPDIEAAPPIPPIQQPPGAKKK